MNLEDPTPEEDQTVPPKKSKTPELDPPAPAPEAPEAEPAATPDPEVDLTEVHGTGVPELDPVPVRQIGEPSYSLWEKISPPARRKKQFTTMESGSREVLALVRSIRENMDQQVRAQKKLVESLDNLPEAIDSVRQLADYTGQHAEMLRLMHDQMETSLDNHRNMGESVTRFNDTLLSMDKTTQLLLERAQRSEERLHKMLRRAQRRMALMMILLLILFLGGVFAVVHTVSPETTEKWIYRESEPVAEAGVPAPPASDQDEMTTDADTTPHADVLPPAAAVETAETEDLPDAGQEADAVETILEALESVPEPEAVTEDVPEMPTDEAEVDETEEETEDAPVIPDSEIDEPEMPEESVEAAEPDVQEALEDEAEADATDEVPDEASEDEAVSGEVSEDPQPADEEASGEEEDNPQEDDV